MTSTPTSTPALHPTPASRHRFHALDGLRGVASLLVVAWHAPLYLHLRGAHGTYLAVDFFFCLSGFVIAFSYERRLANPRDLRRFVIARLIRLYPMYLLAAAAALLPYLLIRHHPGGGPAALLLLLAFLLAQLLMLPNLRISQQSLLYPLDFPAWSLFFELLANFAYGFAVAKKWAGTKAIAVLYLLSFGALAWWIAIYGNADVGWETPPHPVSLARTGLSFCAGVLMLRLYRHQSTHRGSRRLGAVVTVLITVALVLCLRTDFALLRTPFFLVLDIGLLFPLMVYLGARCTVPSSWEAPCSLLGDLSYPIYLLHVPLMSLLDIAAVHQWLLRHPQWQRGVLPIVIVITGGLGWLVLRFIDAPLRSYLTRRFNQHTSAGRRSSARYHTVEV